MYLFLGAHPDDIELGCGGVLSIFGSEAKCVIMTHGERKAGNRMKEAMASSEFLGYQIAIVGFRDTELDSYREQTISIIEHEIRAINPEYIFTMFPDYNQDHRALYEATVSAARRSRSILLYEVPLATSSEFTPTVFCDITNHLSKKLQAISLYPSQNIDLESVTSMAKVRATQGRINGYAEAFMPVRMNIGGVFDGNRN